MRRAFSIRSDRVNAMMIGTRRILDKARMSGVEIASSSSQRFDHIGGPHHEKKPNNSSEVSSGASSAK
jgi:hypothetical protein